MIRRLVLAIFCVGLAGCAAEPSDWPAGEAQTVSASVVGAEIFPELSGQALIDALDDAYSPPRTLGYGPARDVLFSFQQDQFGALCGVYTAVCVQLSSGGDPSQSAMALGLNTEHTWPQSVGARDEPLRSDMHHLFPSVERVNASRGSLPFGEVSDGRAEAWYRLMDSQSNRPRAAIDEWSERGQGRFEPREDRKGDIARAVLYVYTMYREQVDAHGGSRFFSGQEKDLLDWNDLDPVSEEEAARNTFIAEQQGTANPFVLDPTLARRAYDPGSALGSNVAQPATPAPRPAPVPSPPRQAPSGGTFFVSEIKYDNPGDDVGEGVEIAGPPGASLDGWSVAVYNGSGGTVYGTFSLSGRLPASGALWLDVPGLQNGSPDGLALVRPDGAVAEFLSYEGFFDASEGPASGQTSTDIGLAHGRDGGAIHRDVAGGPWRLGAASPGQLR